jgi:hypothetical protein
LDNIIPDLWNEIIKYMGYHVVVGHSFGTYPGYRQMRKNEFNEKLFIDYYLKEGTLQNISDLDIGFVNLIIDGYMVMSEYGRIGIHAENANIKNAKITVGIFSLNKSYRIFISGEKTIQTAYYTLFVPDI